MKVYIHSYHWPDDIRQLLNLYDYNIGEVYEVGEKLRSITVNGISMIGYDSDYKFINVMDCCEISIIRDKIIGKLIDESQNS